MGLSATTIWMVEQFGFAIIFFLEYWATAWALTSGTIKGTSGSIRKALVLSMTTQPAFPAMGANFWLTDPPGEKSPISIPAKEFSFMTSTVYSFPLNSILVPAPLVEASSFNLSTG